MRNAILWLPLFLVGCTTVANGPMQKIAVDSVPRGAAVEVKRCGALATKNVTTPGVIWVSRRSTQCRLVFRMPYYDEQTVRLSRHTAPNMDSYAMGVDIILDASRTFDDIFALGTIFMLPSLAVDAASGSMFELQPNYVSAALTPANQEWRDRRP